MFPQTSLRYSSPNSFSIPDTSVETNSMERCPLVGIGLCAVYLGLWRPAYSSGKALTELLCWSLRCDAVKYPSTWTTTAKTCSHIVIPSLQLSLTALAPPPKKIIWELLLKNRNKKRHNIKEVIAKLWKDESSIATESGVLSEKVRLDQIGNFFSEELQIQQHLVYCLSCLLDLP